MLFQICNLEAWGFGFVIRLIGMLFFNMFSTLDIRIENPLLLKSRLKIWISSVLFQICNLEALG